MLTWPPAAAGSRDCRASRLTSVKPATATAAATTTQIWPGRAPGRKTRSNRPRSD